MASLTPFSGDNGVLLTPQEALPNASDCSSAASSGVQRRTLGVSRSRDGKPRMHKWRQNRVTGIGLEGFCLKPDTYTGS